MTGKFIRELRGKLSVTSVAKEKFTVYGSPCYARALRNGEQFTAKTMKNKRWEIPNERKTRGPQAHPTRVALITVLQQDCDVRYNPARIREVDFSDSGDLFLHGLLGEDRTGTCVSLPVLYVALGRRLGYPLKLVTTNGHIFARWQSPDGKERFNIEGTNQGLSCFEDAYYQRWPHKITEQDIRACRYLKSLTPKEELALFLATRGHCLEAIGQLPQAQLAYVHAHRLEN